MGGLAKDEESAGLQRPKHGKITSVRPILEGRPWVCTEQEQRWLDDLHRGFELFRPRVIGGLP